MLRPRPLLPQWVPLALLATAVASIPLLFMVPRPSGFGLETYELVDTLLEAIPFVIAAAALLAVPFTQRGPLRTAGIVLGIALVTAPFWYATVLFGIQDLTADPPEGRFRLLVTPEENVPYTLLIPLPEDAGVDAQTLRAFLGSGSKTEVVEGEHGLALRVSADGPVDEWDRIVDYTGPWVWWHGRWDTESTKEAPLQPVLEAGNTTVAFTLQFDYSGECRTARSVLVGSANPTDGFARVDGWGVVC